MTPKQKEKFIQSFINKVGANIRVARHAKKMTQLELAELADVSAKHVSLLENERADNLSIKYLMQIALALDVSFDELVSQDEF
jgi:transcriptional regulator with XRE-family HTH domain